MSAEKQRIGPHDEAGFAPVDVLEQAEKDDRIELEMQFYDGSFEFLSGTVDSATVKDTSDDGRMQLKNVHVDTAGDYEAVVINVHFDPESAHNLITDDVRFTPQGGDEYEFRELENLANCELVREDE
ncbi:hypothetical protein [Haloarcula amylovorans]|uniref:hypothetical protein n=1 Tax=Haloarcula amylovorans TaxID=2562280 RepID=UPI001076BD15|nr:hypothetical protein [Halomicroarcula amylolytica]